MEVEFQLCTLTLAHLRNGDSSIPLVNHGKNWVRERLEGDQCLNHSNHNGYRFLGPEHHATQFVLLIFINSPSNPMRYAISEESGA